MYNLFAPSLFQKKTCKLPGIGTLSLIAHEAASDFINTSIKAPYQEIIFTPASVKENVFNEFSAISELIIRKLNTEGEVNLEGVGIFTKGDDGVFIFTPLQLDEVYTPAVRAERMVRQHAKHTILVGDKETTNEVMAEFYTEEIKSTTDNWWIWAIIILATSIAILIYYFMQDGNASLGNALPI
jgi:hypothetical protein